MLCPSLRSEGSCSPQGSLGSGFPFFSLGAADSQQRSSTKRQTCYVSRFLSLGRLRSDFRCGRKWIGLIGQHSPLRDLCLFDYEGSTGVSSFCRSGIGSRDASVWRTGNPRRLGGVGSDRRNRARTRLSRSAGAKWNEITAASITSDIKRSPPRRATTDLRTCDLGTNDPSSLSRPRKVCCPSHFLRKLNLRTSRDQLPLRIPNMDPDLIRPRSPRSFRRYFPTGPA